MFQFKATSSILTVLKTGARITAPVGDARLRLSMNGAAIVAESNRLSGGSYLYYRRFPKTRQGLQDAIEFLQNPTLAG